MATFRTKSTLKHRLHLGMDVQDLHFEAGEVVEVLERWKDFWLVRDAAGHILNVPKEMLKD